MKLTLSMPVVPFVDATFWASAIGGHYDVMYLAPEKPKKDDDGQWIIPPHTITVYPEEFIQWFGGDVARQMLRDLRILDETRDDRPFDTRHARWVPIELSYPDDGFYGIVKMQDNIDGYL